MFESSESIFLTVGSLVFLGSLLFFTNRLRKSLRQARETPSSSSQQTFFAYVLFFTLANFGILLVIWIEPLRGLFVEMLFVCIIIAWLGWKTITRETTG